MGIKMSIKLRFSLALSLLILVLITGFSLLVYSNVKTKLFGGGEQAVRSHLEGEWNFIVSGGNSLVRKPKLTFHSKRTFVRVWRNGILIQDSFPSGVQVATPVHEKEIQDGNKIVSQWQRDLGDDHYVLLAYYDLSATGLYLAEFSGALLLGCLLTVLIVFPVSWAVANSLLLPFHGLAERTAELDAQKLSFRFPEPSHMDEYGSLVKSFNSLLTRLEKSFEQIRRFATNASHELRTPLTVIRGEAELTLRRPRAAAEYESALKSILSQAETLQKIIGRLLLLADLERMERESARVAIDVGSAVSDTVRALGTVYGVNGKSVDIAAPAAEVVFQGHQEIFSSVVGNLVENAFKYSKGHVRIGYRKDAQGLHLSVEDDGNGIPANLREEAFEPFFQAPGVKRYRGHGLGLSIVKACVEAARGKIGLGTSALGGLMVDVLLPENA